MHTHSFKFARSAYRPWLQFIEDVGDEVEVRGRKTKEVLNAITEITEPWHHCILIPSRRWNPWLALSEAMWILAGRNDVATLLPYNSRIIDYSDDGKTLYGAYGFRFYDQIEPLIKRLKNDPSDRRCVLQIWDHFVFSDLYSETKDPPCNNLVYFKLRENKLHMTVINRSNDLHWGLFAVNLPTFGILQEYIAARLCVDIGTQTHFSNSLHIYTDRPEVTTITNRMLYDQPDDLGSYPKHGLIFEPEEMDGYNHDDIAWLCERAFTDFDLPTKAPPFFFWAQNFLKAYRDKTPIQDSERFADWVKAGRMFRGE